MKSAILTIEGMMCPHCEANVKKCIENFENVAEARVSHVTGTAEIVYECCEPDFEKIKQAITALGYKVIK